MMAESRRTLNPCCTSGGDSTSSGLSMEEKKRRVGDRGMACAIPARLFSVLRRSSGVLLGAYKEWKVRRQQRRDGESVCLHDAIDQMLKTPVIRPERSECSRESR